MNPEMGLAARPMAGMAVVLVQFVHDIEALRRERRRQLFGDEIVLPCMAPHSGWRGPVNGRVRDNSMPIHHSHVKT